MNLTLPYINSEVVIPAKAGIQPRNTGFRVKPGMTNKGKTFLNHYTRYEGSFHIISLSACRGCKDEPCPPAVFRRLRGPEPAHPQISETAYPVGHDTDRRVEEALGRQPLKDQAHESQALFRLIFDDSEAFQRFQNDRILKLRRSACLCSQRSSQVFRLGGLAEKRRVGKKVKGVDFCGIIF